MNIEVKRHTIVNMLKFVPAYRNIQETDKNDYIKLVGSLVNNERCKKITIESNLLKFILNYTPAFNDLLFNNQVEYINMLSYITKGDSKLNKAYAKVKITFIMNDDNKIANIKALRWFTNMGLRESKEGVEQGGIYEIPLLTYEDVKVKINNDHHMRNALWQVIN